MAQPSCSCEGSAIEGRQRERESAFPMVPVDEAIGEVLKQATTLEAVTVKLADIPAGDDIRAVHKTQVKLIHFTIYCIILYCMLYSVLCCSTRK